MRVFILTLGTRGDFEPFWALGRELHRRGHAVTIGTSPFYAQPGLDPDLAWVPIGSGTHSELIAVLASLGEIQDVAKRAHAFLDRWLRPQLTAGASQISLTGTASNYVICNLKVPLRRRGSIMPGAFVSYDPPDAVAKLAPSGSSTQGERMLDLVAMNRALIDPLGKWGDEYHFTGFWTPPHQAAAPSAALSRFIESGPAPVVMTTGSMVNFDARRLAREFSEALRIAGQRGVVVTGWSGLRCDDAADERLLMVEEADYDALFARAACVIHHGGVGTVAAVLRAGVPSILLPQVGSQQQFGRILQREQLCAGVFDTASLVPAALAASIRDAIEYESIRDAARRWQAIVRADRGVQLAGELIEAHWARIGHTEERSVQQSEIN
jgi:UDP:flavonoid glycosyltransferase YjiC (YdhE family)